MKIMNSLAGIVGNFFSAGHVNHVTPADTGNAIILLAIAGIVIYLVTRISADALRFAGGLFLLWWNPLVFVGVSIFGVFHDCFWWILLVGFLAGWFF